MSSTTPLTDSINNLTTYANSVTGASDTNLSDAVATLASGYGGGGGDTLYELFNGTLESYDTGDVEYIHPYAFSNVTGLLTLRLSGAIELDQYILQDSSVQCVVAPNVSRFRNWRVFRYAKNLRAIDILGASQFNKQAMDKCTVLETLILRKTSVVALDNIDALGGTPFDSSGTGGTLYVPSALISAYQSATNWSTILGYSTNSIQAIEGSIYETQYADGTPIASS